MPSMEERIQYAGYDAVSAYYILPRPREEAQHVQIKPPHIPYVFPHLRRLRPSRLSLTPTR